MIVSNNKAYTVWVGGTEVNDYLLTDKEAREIAADYTAMGYDDVIYCLNNEVTQ